MVHWVTEGKACEVWVPEGDELIIREGGLLESDADVRWTTSSSSSASASLESTTSGQRKLLRFLPTSEKIKAPSLGGASVTHILSPKMPNRIIIRAITGERRYKSPFFAAVYIE